MQVVNLFKDICDLNKKFSLDLKLFKNYEDQNHKVSFQEMDSQSKIIKVNDHENYYFLLDDLREISKRGINPDSINIFEIIPSLDSMRACCHLVLRKKGKVSFEAKIK